MRKQPINLLDSSVLVSFLSLPALRLRVHHYPNSFLCSLDTFDMMFKAKSLSNAILVKVLRSSEIFNSVSLCLYYKNLKIHSETASMHFVFLQLGAKVSFQPSVSLILVPL